MLLKMPAPSEITPAEVQALAERGAPIRLIDVRQSWEYDNVHIPGVLLIPLAELPRRVSELDPGEPVICICEHGIRSAHAAQFLIACGFSNAATMTGGMAEYAGPVQSNLPDNFSESRF